MRHLSATVFALLACSAGAVRAQDAAPAVPAPETVLAPASAIQIALPFNNAIVRESVPVKLRDFPPGGYVAISIDDRFVTAQALPKNRSAAVFVWDTKASYTLPNDPNTPVYYADGPHAITLAVYDAQSKLAGKDTVKVTVANKINLPASQGIKLAYPWSLSTNLHYQRRTTLTAIAADASTGDAPQTLQESLLRYRRTVENATAGTFLLRDEAQPVEKPARAAPFVSYVSTRGLSQPLNLYPVRARYRVVNAQGRVLSDVGDQNGGEQLGFSIPVLPPRRISVGAHWETPVQMTLDWASPYPTTVTATSTLEDFEWQDRYPTAKIRETYTGPAAFLPRSGSPLPLIQSQDIKFERIVYFAYNAGRIVRMQTTLTLTTTAPGLISTAASPTGQYPGGVYPGGPGQNPGAYPGQYPGNGEGPPAPGAYPGGPGRLGPSAPGSYPGGAYPGGPPGGYPGGAPYPGQAAPPAPPATVLKYTETSVILI